MSKTILKIKDWIVKPNVQFKVLARTDENSGGLIWLVKRLDDGETLSAWLDYPSINNTVLIIDRFSEDLIHADIYFRKNNEKRKEFISPDEESKLLSTYTVNELKRFFGI